MRVSALVWSHRDGSSRDGEQAPVGGLRFPPPVRRGPGDIHLRPPHGVIPRAKQADQEADDAGSAADRALRWALPPVAAVALVAG